MNDNRKHFLVGGAFALIAHLAAFLWFTLSVVFPFEWFQKITVLGILFAPGIFYCVFVNKRPISFAVGTLAGHIVVLSLSYLLGWWLYDPFVNFIEPLVMGETGLLFGIEFIVDFFLRFIAIGIPPIIHLIAHAIAKLSTWLRSRQNPNAS